MYIRNDRIFSAAPQHNVYRVIKYGSYPYPLVFAFVFGGGWGSKTVNNMLSIENYIITNRISKYLCQTNEFLRREWGV